MPYLKSSINTDHLKSSYSVQPPGVDHPTAPGKGVRGGFIFSAFVLLSIFCELLIDVQLIDSRN